MSLEVTKKRVNKLVSLATAIETKSVLTANGNYVILRDVGTSVSEYLKEHYDESEIINQDIDLDIIDEIFTVKIVCGHGITTFNPNFMIGTDKQAIINAIYSLENLKSLLNSDSDAPKTSELVEEETIEAKQELISVNDKDTNGSMNFQMSGDMMTNFMIGELMSAFSHNPMITMQLMQKQVEGKLNKDVLMKLSTFNNGPGFRNNPMSTMMVMQILNSL